MPQGVIKSYRLFFWLAIIIFSNLLFSCKNEDCFSIFNNDMLISFNVADTLDTGEIITEAIDTMFYAIVADGNDSIFYGPETRASLFMLQVDPAAEYTSFEFYMIDSVATDTISQDPLVIEATYFPNPIPHQMDIIYRSGTRVITEDCGVEIGYVGLDVSETTFPGYEIERDILDRFTGTGTNDDVNVKVYF